MPALGGSWAPLRHSLGPLERGLWSSWAFLGRVFGPLRVFLGPLGRLWGPLGASWGGSWAPLGFFGLLGRFLGASWRLLGGPGALPERFLGPPRPYWVCSRALLGRFWARHAIGSICSTCGAVLNQAWGFFGTSCDGGCRRRRRRSWWRPEAATTALYKPAPRRLTWRTPGLT